MSTPHGPNLHQLLEVENDSALLEFTCRNTGLPLWPQIRVVYLRMLISDLLYGTPVTGRSATRAPAARAMATLLRSALHNARARLAGGPQRDICITGDGVADSLVDGRWFNRLSDHFALTCGRQTVVLANHFEWRWPLPRHHDRIVFHAPQQVRNAVVGALAVRDTHRRLSRQLVGLVDERARRLLGWTAGALRLEQLAGMLARKTAALPSQYRTYRALLGRIRPRLLIVGAGCYGPAASLIAAARDAGITTAEYQHGAVSAGHDAYNFAPAIVASQAYRRTLPDHFLGYGTWWNDQINAPVGKVVIGNPHREARLRQFTDAPDSKQDILILSDGIEFPLYLDLARQIEPGAASRGLRVVLRPHPLERTRVASEFGKGTDRIAIDQNADLYASLRCAHAVISEVSTGVFEAVGLAERILIWDTPKSRFGYPHHPFQTFSSPTMLLELLDCSEVGQLNRTQASAIWAFGWLDNYRAFLSEHGIDCA